MFAEILVCHLIGDYVLQTDWMAQNKKSPGNKGELAAFTHTVFYMLPFLTFCLVSDSVSNMNLHLSPLQLVLIALQHFLQDRTNFVVWFMKVKGSGQFVKDLAPWSIIVTDNVLHIIWMYFVITVL